MARNEVFGGVNLQMTSGLVGHPEADSLSWSRMGTAGRLWLEKRDHLTCFSKDRPVLLRIDRLGDRVK